MQIHAIVVAKEEYLFDGTPRRVVKIKIKEAYGDAVKLYMTKQEFDQVQVGQQFNLVL